MSRTNGYLNGMQWSPKLNCCELCMLHCKYIQWNDCGINVISCVQHNTIFVIPLYIFAVYTTHRRELIFCCPMILPITYTRLYESRNYKGEEVQTGYLYVPCTLVMYQVRLGEFLLQEIKIAFQGIQRSACAQNNPTKLVVWSFSTLSTVPPLCSFLVLVLQVF